MCSTFALEGVGMQTENIRFFECAVRVHYYLRTQCTKATENSNKLQMVANHRQKDLTVIDVLYDFLSSVI